VTAESQADVVSPIEDTVDVSVGVDEHRRIHLMLQRPVFVIALCVLTVTIILALFAPVIAPYSFSEQIPGRRLQAPNADHLFGTDQYGRDIASRVIYGTRISLMVASITVLIAGVVGISAGLISGYYGGWVDNVLMRIFDIIMAYPSIILAITVILVLGRGTLNVAYALAIVNIPVFARLTRARVLTERQREHVLNARSIGCNDVRIMLHHIFPNIYGTLLVQASLAMGVAIVTEAGLSFLGLGAQPPAPSWGAMVSDARRYLREAWWYSVYPGAAIAILIFAINSFTDVLRDVFATDD